MASTTAIKVYKDLSQDSSDIADLWRQAIEEFEDRTGQSLSYGNVDEIMKEGQKQKEDFARYRHSGSTTDRIRTAFGKSLEHIERILQITQGAVEIASNAAPPAMMAVPLIAAFSFVLKAFTGVTADYDRIEEFFAVMNGFLDRLSTVECDSPKLDPFQRCVKQVFLSMFRICGIAANLQKKKRLKAVFKVLVNGAGDRELADEYSKMEVAIKDFESVVGLSTMKLTVEINQKVTTFNDTLNTVLKIDESIKADVKENLRQTDTITRQTDTISRQTDTISQDLRTLMDRYLKKGKDESLEESSKHGMREMESMLEKPKGLEAQRKQGKRKHEDSSGQTSPISRIRRHFADSIQIRKRLKVLREDLTLSLVEGTAQWFFERDEYRSWLASRHQHLWISGAAGLGKTFLALAIILDLEKRFEDQNRTSIAYFFFREEEASLRSFRDALRCAVIQIAEQDSDYCKHVAKEIGRNEDESPWKQYFAERYPTSANASLYFVLDGIDESSEEDQNSILNLFHEVLGADLNIKLLLTSRSKITTAVEDSHLSLHLHHLDLREDISKFINARCDPRSRLASDRFRKFGPRTRKRIMRKLADHADGMLYVELMLRRLDAIGSQSAVHQDLESNSPNGLEALFELLEAECIRGRTDSQHKSLQTLFSMVAFTRRPFTVDEAAKLLKLSGTDQPIDIEDEMNRSLGQILDTYHGLDDDRNDEVDTQSPGSVSDEEDSISEELVNHASIHFLHRALKDYFRALKTKEHGLRSCASLAHCAIVLVCSDLLTNPFPADRSRVDGLHEYAIDFWADHFASIHLDDLGDEHIESVLEGVAKIVRNGNNVSLWMENADGFQYNASIENFAYTKLDDRTKLIASIDKCIESALSRTSLAIDSELRTWAETVQKSKKELLTPLAKGHVLNWANALIRPLDPSPSSQYHILDRRSWLALNSCYLARNALLLANVFDSSQCKSPKQAILQVADHYQDVVENAKMLRAIGLALFCEGEHNDAIDYCLRSLRIGKEKDDDSIYTYWIIACALRRQYSDGETSAHDEDVDNLINDHLNIAAGTTEDVGEQKKFQQEIPSVSGADEDPMAESDKASEHQQMAEQSNARENFKVVSQRAMKLQNIALATLAPDWRDDLGALKDREGIAWILHDHANCHAIFDNIDIAIEHLDMARSVNPLTTFHRYILSRMTIVRNWSGDPHAYISMFRSWTTKERNHWFEYNFQWRGIGTLDEFHRLAKEAGSRDFDFVVQCFEDYMATIARHSSKLIGPLIDLQAFYQHVMCDHKKALEVCTRTLDELSDEDEVIEYPMFRTRLWKATLLFEQFRKSGDVKEKFEILGAVEQLSSRRIGHVTYDDWREASITLTLAMMNRCMGQKLQFQELIEECFLVCKRTLSDSFGSNDSHGFRLLAKVLACVPGLERDSQIALSCQLYITDPEVGHGENADAKPAKENHSDQEVRSELNSEDEMSDNKSSSLSQGEETQEEIRSSSLAVTVDTKTDPQPISNEDLEQVTHQIDSGTESDTGNSIKNSQIGQNDTNGTPAEGTAAMSTMSLLPIEERGASCDGDCDTFLNTWETPLHICIQCGDVDLCDSCLEKRRAMDRGEPSPSWKSWCGQDHAYIRGPVKGWIGVETGVILIAKKSVFEVKEGEEDEVIEKISFKKWLEDLEKVKFPEAWERFWREEDFLKNIGF